MLQHHGLPAAWRVLVASLGTTLHRAALPGDSAGAQEVVQQQRGSRAHPAVPTHSHEHLGGYLHAQWSSYPVGGFLLPTAAPRDAPKAFSLALFNQHQQAALVSSAVSRSGLWVGAEAGGGYPCVQGEAFRHPYILQRAEFNGQRSQQLEQLLMVLRRQNSRWGPGAAGGL